MTRKGMAIDLKRCVGCAACAMACKLENATGPGVFWARCLEKEEGKFPAAKRVFLPVLCNHCKEALCEKVCPSGATHRGPNGEVLIDSNKCIGCRACVTACPYEARFFYKDQRSYFPGYLTPYEKQGYAKHQPGTVEKCDFCQRRAGQGKEPACVAACPAKARTFGDLDDSRGELQRLIRARQGTQLLHELGTDPSVYYLS